MAAEALFDNTFRDSLGKYTLYIAIIFIVLNILIHYSALYYLPQACPTWTGVTYYTIPIY
jgi:hypothetical protein